MKRLLMFVLSTTSLACNVHADSTLSDLAATVLFPSFTKWAKEMREKVYTTFDMIVPEAERANWKRQKDADWDGAELGDVNEYVTGRWIPVNDDPERWTERVLIDYRNTNTTNQSNPYASVDDFIDIYKKNVKSVYKSHKDLTIKKIGNNEVTIEYAVEDPKTKQIVYRTVERCVLLGEWLVSLIYEIKPSRYPEKEKTWTQNSQKWLNQFSLLQLE